MSVRRYRFDVVDDAGHVCCSATVPVARVREVTAEPGYGPTVRLLREGELISIARGYRQPGRALQLHRRPANRPGARPVVVPIPPAWPGLR